MHAINVLALITSLATWQTTTFQGNIMYYQLNTLEMGRMSDYGEET